MRRTWAKLATEIQQYNNQPHCWPENLPLEAYRRFQTLKDIDQMLLQKITGVIHSELSDIEKHIRLRLILAKRGILIANTSLDYTLNPRSPVNQACLKIAEFIAEKEEPICRLLMPRIKKIICTSPTPNDLHAASTDTEEQFVLTHFLISADGEALISLEDMIEHTANDTDLFFVHTTNPDTMLYLTREDRVRVHRINQRYFDQLEDIHRIKQGKKPSVGWALYELKTALLRASVAEAGAETAVNTLECREPVFAFYRIWRHLSIEIKNKIRNYKAQGGTFTLESYLLRLFVNLKEDATDIHIAEEELRRVIQEDIFPCANQIGKSLDSLLAHHPDLLTFPLPGREADFNTPHLPNAEALVQLQKQSIAELAIRPPILGTHDQRVISGHIIFTQLFQNIENNRYVLEQNIMDLYPYINTLSDLTDALLLIPKHKWGFFLLCIEKKWMKIFILNPADQTYTFILNALPMDEWSAFFKACKQAELKITMSGRQLAVVLNGLSPTQWDCFKDAIEYLIPRILNHPIHIANLFISISDILWKTLYRTFKQFIEDSIYNPTMLSQLFIEMPTAYWSNLRDTLGFTFQTIMQDPATLTQFLLEMSINQRDHFVFYVANFNENTPITTEFLIALFTTLSDEAMKSIILQLDVRRIKKLLANGKNMALLLNQFPTASWPHIYSFFPDNHTTIFFRDLFVHMPAEKWYDTADFFREKINFLHIVDHSLFSHLLGAIASSLQLQLFHILLPSFSVYPFEPQIFSDLFKIFDSKDWPSVAQLLKLHIEISLNTPYKIQVFFNAFKQEDRKKISSILVQMMLKIESFDPGHEAHWRSACQRFSDKISLFLEEPIHIALMYYSVPSYEWPDLSCLIRSHLQTQLHDNNFLETLFSAFHPSDRITLFDALQDCFNQVTPENITVILKLHPVENWPKITTKLRQDKMRNPFFNAIKEIARFLNQFDTEVLDIIYTLFQRVILPLLQAPYAHSLLSDAMSPVHWQTLLSLLPTYPESHQSPLQRTPRLFVTNPPRASSPPVTRRPGPLNNRR